MNESRVLIALVVVILADTLGFLFLVPALIPDVPSGFRAFVFALLILLVVYTGIAFGIFGRLLRLKKR